MWDQHESTWAVWRVSSSSRCRAFLQNWMNENESRSICSSKLSPYTEELEIKYYNNILPIVWKWVWHRPISIYKWSPQGPKYKNDYFWLANHNDSPRWCYFKLILYAPRYLIVTLGVPPHMSAK
jgi:hypothetical protein